MNHERDLVIAWIRVGSVCGFVSFACYILAVFAPLPDTIVLAAAFAFGPLLAIALIGLYHCLALHRRGPLVQIATLCGVGGGLVVLLMLSTQQAIFSALRSAQPDDEQARLLFATTRSGLNAVHFGLDVAWDILISSAVILFGIAMLRHPVFGRLIGSIGIVCGFVLLAFNLYYFPTPPASANSIDWGPLVALWLLVSFFLLTFKGLKWAKQQETESMKHKFAVGASV
ncbi:MAG TPA: hypothetical protein VJ023_15820 [Pyrinomonadaceae bacterium]|nr:hypothetical protein [Pyrinomonadaceae bacterium]